MNPPTVINVAAAPGWKLVCALAHSGFLTDVPRPLLNRICDKVWNIQDGYGTPGYTPAQGWDWSGIRDSSDDAKRRMAKMVRNELLKNRITQIQLGDFNLAAIKLVIKEIK